ncbi:hypothetical protein ECZU23_06970 [Escherichia coli]|nr:hypothetical protein ECZU23_06970 [Escherichia coli]
MFYGCDIAKTNRRAVLVGDDQLAILFGGLHLVVRGKRDRTGRAVEATFAELTLAPVIAVRTVSLVRPRAAIA